MTSILTAVTQKGATFAFAWVTVDASGVEHHGQGCVVNSTSYRMELRAVVEALESLPGGPITVVDCPGVEQVLAWSYGWRARGWRKKKGQIQDLDLVKRLVCTVDAADVTFSKPTGPSAATKRVKQMAKQALLSAPAATIEPETSPSSTGPLPSAAPSVVAASNQRLVAYTDGGCRGNPGIGGWGFILTDTRSGHGLSVRGGATETTNNRMELQAAVEALMALKTHGQSIEIRTDSAYVRDVATKWMSGWKRRGWVKKDGEPVKNRDVIEQLDTVMQHHNVVWTKVKGHSGEPGNEHADQLTNDAMDDIARGLSGDATQRYPRSPLHIDRQD